jgi:hypothetical protein
MRFAADVELTLPYDPKLLPSGLSGADVYTYFFDDVSSCWVPLQRKSVDKVHHTVTSVTNHFTDFINSTVTVPEHPENVSFNPNQIKGISTAGASAKVNLIAPPGASSSGDNGLSYPIEVPPGRLGLAPQLGVSYSSSAGDGWLGVGWDLQVGSITVDTRWGVPRYDAGKETETYLLNGEQLTPVAHRGAPIARSSERVFHTRVEGGFAQIVRHGSDPKSYRWEVTDKSGAHYFYGALPGASGPDAGATLLDGLGNVFMWGLQEVRDLHGNFVRYHYTRVDDAGVAPGLEGGSEPGRNLYVSKITYTGSGATEGRYSVTFVRDRDLNEALRVDKAIDARGGFKRVTADLLRQVEVKLDTGPPEDPGAASVLVRRYDLTYRTGAFKKTLLASIAQFDDQGVLFNTHEFSYFDDVPRDGQGNYQAFQSADWTVPGDGLNDATVDLTPANAGKASALNANSSLGGGGHLYLGWAATGPSKSGSLGVKVGGEHSSSDGVLALVDVDGDGLPDKVFRTRCSGMGVWSSTGRISQVRGVRRVFRVMRSRWVCRGSRASAAIV